MGVTMNMLNIPFDGDDKRATNDCVVTPSVSIYNDGYFHTISHQTVESVMSELGILWKEQIIFVSEIDTADSHFQTRASANHFSKNTVNEYRERILAGDLFPRITVQRKSGSRYRVVAGRHRAAAYSNINKDGASISAYVVDKATDDDLLLKLSMRENSANGLRQSASDTVRIAASFLFSTPPINGGRYHRTSALRTAATQYGVNLSTLRNQYLTLLVDAALLRVNVDPQPIDQSVKRAVWSGGWTESADWPLIAKTLHSKAHIPRLTDAVQLASKDKLDGAGLIKRLNDFHPEAAAPKSYGVPVKDRATAILEHLQLALNDFEKLTPPTNLSEEIAEDIVGVVEAIKFACKKWRSR